MNKTQNNTFIERSRNIPQLRFSEFSDEWKNIEFKEVVTINPKNKKLPNSFIYIDLESVNNGVLNKKKRINKVDAPSRAQRILLIGDVLFQTVRPYQKNNYFFDKSEGDYVASTGYAQIRTKKNSSFIYQYLHTDYFVNKVLIRCTGTSYPAINSTDLSKIKVNIPQLQEQQKIASFLTDVDLKITKLTTKKTLLEQYKKGVMQQIFNQEIRFSDKNGNKYPKWEEKMLGEIAKITTGKIDANAMIEGGKYRFYTCAKNYFKIDNYIFDTEALLISGNGANVGYIHYYKGKFNAYQRTYVLDGFSENIQYIKCFLDKNLHQRISNEKKDGNTPYIVLSTLKDMKIKIPCKEEQTQIANFLASIDVKINQVANQLEKTKTFKKGLLQQMFV